MEKGVSIISASNYDEWAKVYDLIYGKYSEDLEFYKREAKKAGGPVLEVGCGTGRIYLGLLKEGIDAYGIDISEGMLNSLKKKATEENLVPKIYLADMRDFSLGMEFNLIIVPFRSFLYNLSTEDQLKSLSNFYRHLKPGGRLILNFFYPDLERMMSFGKESEDLLISDSGNYVLREKSYFVNEPDQIIQTDAVIFKGGELYWQGSFRLALIYKKEFELLLRIAGFSNWVVYGSFDYKPLTSFKQEMIWIVDKL